MHPTTDPLDRLVAWLREAETTEPDDANAMALATVDVDGLPNVRMVLMKRVTADGLVFFTNTESQKGTELAGNMRAAAVLHWKSLRRQVRVRGPVEPTDPAEADAYFATRARDSQLGAWASQQSRPLASRSRLDRAVAAYAEQFRGGDVPRPPHWAGYLIQPVYLEFWSEGANRLHDRLVFAREKPTSAWSSSLLSP